MKKLVMFGAVVGSTIGGFIPMLWGADFLSMSGIIFSFLGGLLGIWLAFRISE